MQDMPRVMSMQHQGGMGNMGPGQQMPPQRGPPPQSQMTHGMGGSQAHEMPGQGIPERLPAHGMAAPAHAGMQHGGNPPPGYTMGGQQPQHQGQMQQQGRPNMTQAQMQQMRMEQMGSGSGHMIGQGMSQQGGMAEMRGGMAGQQGHMVMTGQGNMGTSISQSQHQMGMPNQQPMQSHM